MVCQLHVPDGDSSGKSGCSSVDADQSEKLAELPALSAGSGAVWTCGSAFCLSRLDYFSGTFGDCLLYQHSGLSGNGHSRRQDGPQ